jgi:hypothetical protein
MIRSVEKERKKKKKKVNGIEFYRFMCGRFFNKCSSIFQFSSERLVAEFQIPELAHFYRYISSLLSTTP